MPANPTLSDRHKPAFVDLHAHLVPGVDDGPAGEAQAVAMLRQAEAAGTEVIVVTPHLFSSHNLVADVEAVLARRDEFLAKLALLDFHMKILPGAEVYFTTGLSDLLRRHNIRISLNGSAFFILEFPFDFVFPGSRDFIYGLLSDGWVPVVAHPERNQVIQRHPEVLYEWVKLGALAQVNGGSFMGDFGGAAQASAFTLLRANLVHVVASDAHDDRERPPRLDAVYRRLAPEIGDLAGLLFDEVPRAMVHDEALPDTGEPRDPRRKVRFFDFLKRK